MSYLDPDSDRFLLELSFVKFVHEVKVGFNLIWCDKIINFSKVIIINLILKEIDKYSTENHRTQVIVTCSRHTIMPWKNKIIYLR